MSEQAALRAAIDAVAARPCHCVSCGSCHGSGYIWVDFKGRYLGAIRCSDLDEHETCPECDGAGLLETCSRCSEIEELEQQESEP